MRLRILRDLDQVLATFDELAADDTVDEHDIAIGIVTANLALGLRNSTCLVFDNGRFFDLYALRVIDQVLQRL